MEIILSIIAIIVAKWYIGSTERKFDNYSPPEGYRIDNQACIVDSTLNNLSRREIMLNTINGKYNVKDDTKKK